MARQKTQPPQHCFSWSDFGSCRGQPSVTVSVFALAQQLVFLLWGRGVCAGAAAKAIEQKVNPQIRNRSAVRIRDPTLQLCRLRFNIGGMGRRCLRRRSSTGKEALDDVKRYRDQENRDRRSGEHSADDRGTQNAASDGAGAIREPEW